MNVTLSRLAGIVVIILAAGIPLRGDGPAKAKSKGQLPPGHDELARLTGSWDATVTFRIGDKDNQGKATCEAKWILREHCVQQEYNSIFMGGPLTILQFLSFDPAKKKIVEVHMTSLDGGALMNEGESTDGGRVWKLSGPYHDPRTQKATQLRTVYTFEDADHFTLDWFVPDASGKEVRLVHITHTRRK